jgi:hypothetical protein
MNSSPVSSWEGATAYFTFADKPGVMMLIFLVSVVVTIGVIVSAARHENESYRKLLK